MVRLRLNYYRALRQKLMNCNDPHTHHRVYTLQLNK